MPNWTQNTIIVTGKPADLRAFLEAVKWQDEIFDFGRLIPMLGLLKHTGCGSRAIEGQTHSSWYIANPEEPDPSKEIVRAFTPEEQVTLKAIGCESWYDWSVDNWGTKWPACDAEIDSLSLEEGSIEITFNTAWSAPLPIFHKLHEMFPHLSFRCQWRSEDDGYQESYAFEFESAA